MNSTFDHASDDGVPANFTHRETVPRGEGTSECILLYIHDTWCTRMQGWDELKVTVYREGRLLHFIQKHVLIHIIRIIILSRHYMWCY